MSDCAMRCSDLPHVSRRVSSAEKHWLTSAHMSNAAFARDVCERSVKMTSTLAHRLVFMTDRGSDCVVWHMVSSFCCLLMRFLPARGTSFDRSQCLWQSQVRFGSTRRMSLKPGRTWFH
jgi:hypothetical protein